MQSEEAPEAKFDRLKKQLQESILQQYPNPNREGCPGDAVLGELARRTLEESIESDANWQHITRCSPCYAGFLAFNKEVRRRRRIRGAQLAWGLAAAIVLIAAGVVVGFHRNPSSSNRPQNAEVVYAKKIVDIPSMTRSGSAEEPPPIELERKPEELTVKLPIGSRAGAYELQLKKADQQVLSAAANAEIHNGTTAFTVKLNLSRFEPGRYSIVVRQVPYDWNYYPVVIR